MANADYNLSDEDMPESVLIRAVDMLVAAGADPFAEDHNELMPQDTARENGNIFLADHLAAITSARGLSAGTMDPVGRSPGMPGPRL